MMDNRDYDSMLGGYVLGWISVIARHSIGIEDLKLNQIKVKIVDDILRGTSDGDFREYVRYHREGCEALVGKQLRTLARNRQVG